MNIRFWGVRGSIPTPLTPLQIQSKIMAAVQRITPKDLESQEARAKFISNLPEWIYGTTGGNTPCVELVHKNTNIILDAGTGLRVMGKNTENAMHYHMFLSHYHWDHIQGFPFFDFAFNPQTQFDIYSPWEDGEKYFRDQMITPYSPPSVPNSITKKIYFHTIQQGETLNVNDIKVNCYKMKHPGDSYSYSFETCGRKVVYATDVELSSENFETNSQAEAVFKDADLIILDSQYTVEEAYKKKNWGHTAFCYAIDFAIKWNIKALYLFHHEPTYDDKKLNSILQAARWYAQYINHSDLKVYLAKEGHEIKL